MSFEFLLVHKVLNYLKVQTTFLVPINISYLINEVTKFVREDFHRATKEEQGSWACKLAVSTVSKVKMRSCRVNDTY